MKWELTEAEVRSLIEVLGSAKGAFEHISEDPQYQQLFRNQARDISERANVFSTKLAEQFNQQVG